MPKPTTVHCYTFHNLENKSLAITYNFQAQLQYIRENSNIQVDLGSVKFQK